MPWWCYVMAVPVGALAIVGGVVVVMWAASWAARYALPLWVEAFLDWVGEYAALVVVATAVVGGAYLIGQSILCAVGACR